MILLDAFAVVAYLKDEPAATRVAELLRSETCRVTSVGIAEVVDHLVRLGGVDPEDVLLDLVALELLDAIVVDPALGAAAGALRAARYHRTGCAVSMADCVAAEAARHHDAALATADPHLLDLCHEERIEVVALPGTLG